VLAVAAACVIMQRQTAFGRHIYAVGSDPRSARLSGIGVGKVIVSAYVLASILAALTGFLMTARLGSGQATIEDVSIEEHGPGEWSVAQLFVRRPKTGPSPFAKGATVFAAWDEVRERTSAGQAQSAAARACAVYVQRFDAEALDSQVSLELFGPGGPGWQCSAVAPGGIVTPVANLGLLPTAPAPIGPGERGT